MTFLRQHHATWMIKHAHWMIDHAHWMNWINDSW